MTTHTQVAYDECMVNYLILIAVPSTYDTRCGNFSRDCHVNSALLTCVSVRCAVRFLIQYSARIPY